MSLRTFDMGAYRTMFDFRCFFSKHVMRLSHICSPLASAITKTPCG